MTLEAPVGLSLGPGRRELPLNVTGSSIFGRYPKISGEKTYNMFMSDNWMVCLGGYEKVLELLPAGEGRGFFRSIRGDFSIAVLNGMVYKIDDTLGSTLIGSLTTLTGEVFIDENLSQQICIVDGVNAYIYNWGLPAPNLTIQTDGFFGSSLIPNYVTYHDTFFLFGNGLKTGVSTSWYAYAFDTSTTIVEVSDQAFQLKPDYPLAIKRIPGQSSNVLVFGEAVCEVHTHIGSTDNYRRNSSVSIDYGCLSVSTIAASDSYIMWLAINESNAPVIMLFNGQKAEPVSTDGIDYLMGALTRPDLSTAEFFRQDGHLFYLLTFYYRGDNLNEADNLTLLYDLNTKQFFNASDQHLNYHPARAVSYFNNSLYFVSLNNCAIYRWDTDITSIIEDIAAPYSPGEIPIPVDPNLVYEMQRIRICETVREAKTTPFVVETVYITIDMGNQPLDQIFDCLVLMITEDDFPVYPNTRIFSEDSVQVVPEGAGTDDCPGTQLLPKVQMSFSKDGTVTWSNYYDKYCNPVGYRRNILKWDRIGLANEFTVKFRFWGYDKFIVTNGVIRVLSAGRQK